MIYKELGSTGITIPAIVQGVTGVWSGDATNTHNTIKERCYVLHAGIELGMNFLDTADIYGGGLSEEIVGQAVSGLRERVFIASKFFPHGIVKKTARKSLEASLQRLKTDYIDLYQIHWPNPTVSIKNTIHTLSSFVEEGKIRFIGLSNSTLPEILRAKQCAPDNSIVSTQIEYNLMNRLPEKNLLPSLEKLRITSICYSPLNKGRMTGTSHQKKLIESLAKKYDKTVSQIILQWIISRPYVIAVVKSSNLMRTRDNALAADFTIEPNDIEKINDIHKPQLIYVEPKRIRVDIEKRCQYYLAKKNAIENPLDLIPSPENLAKLLLQRGNDKGIYLLLKKVSNNSNRFDYEIDDYDILGNLKIYWAWILAFGDKCSMPCYVLEKQ